MHVWLDTGEGRGSVICYMSRPPRVDRVACGWFPDVFTLSFCSGFSRLTFHLSPVYLPLLYLLPHNVGAEREVLPYAPLC